MMHELIRVLNYIEEKQSEQCSLQCIAAGVSGWLSSVDERKPKTVFSAGEVALIIDKLAEITREEEID